ncbi:MAG TPA: ATP-binding protein [Acidimicrobiales bacterium]|nr:ATP-binding protein [Acidimicrobiales bacterium]
MPTSDEVRLAVPATPEFLRLARVTASGLASRLGFTFDEVEDLRLAIDELCFILIGSRGRAGSVELRYAMVPGALEVEGIGKFTDADSNGTDPDNSNQLRLAAFSQQILSALLDDYAVYRDDEGRTCFRLVKRRGATGEP